jgi:hypothetical protein
MEQHPVPQNVTTFQFRLIGDMTLKQFGYIAVGAILAYICYKLPLPLFLNWLLAAVAGLGGFGFAFLPIEERPMDVWVLSFFKSIYSPTQYVWSRRSASATPPPAPKSAAVIRGESVQTSSPRPTVGNRGAVLQNIFVPGTPVHPAKKSGAFDWLFDMITPKPRQINTMPVPTHPATTRLPSTVHAAMDLTPPPAVRAREQAVEKKLEEAKKELMDTSLTEPRMKELQTQVTDLLAQREIMEGELARLRVQTAPAPAKQGGTYIATPAAKQGPSVRIITQDRAIKVGLPRLTTFPNVVTGIIKDGDQNLLPGVLVTVKDKEGVPLRALKTNRLGQFAASTPLQNGTYFIEIEDPRLRYTFDRAQITLNGTIVPALEIFAKSQKEITRAKLEKELFGDNK